MRKSVRTLFATAIAVPMTFGIAGTAFADDFTQEQDQATSGTVSSDQGASTGQSNTSLAPVTQANPAVNASDILGLSDFANEDGVSSEGQSIVQDNSIDSMNEQGNSASTEQAQKSILSQLTSLEG
ncbi:hypothetical protein WIS52_16665 [Pseudonocardia nematodicida]|uniref:Secreted protein n=1 Tax=Pseudonocardia nematodicida TaxID=1206997 RepID=A0ABV1KFI3_9PSEU